MVREYWERIDKEIKDALFCVALLTLSGSPKYVNVLDPLMVILEMERLRLGIRRVKRET